VGFVREVDWASRVVIGGSSFDDGALTGNSRYQSEARIREP
jgi:hypothetical protein